MLLGVRIIYPSFIKPDKIIIANLPLIEKKLDSAAQKNPFYKKEYPQENIPKKLFVFDPNKVTLEELVLLGFKEKTAKTFLKFRGKRFAFREKEDLKKVYGISDRFYKQLEPYILIEKEKQQDKKEEKTYAVKKQQAKVIELNSADSLLLLEINGVGPAFAKRILKYRSLLGGFIKVEQLKEVYGFTEEMYSKIISQVNVDPSLIKKININTDDFKTVNKHPYLSYELTKLIFNARRKTPVTKDNLKDVLYDEVACQKVLPYLNF